MLSPDQKNQLAERRAEMAQRRAVVHEKDRVARRRAADAEQTMLAQRTLKEASDHAKTANAYEQKALMMSRNDELSRRAIAHAKRAKHEEQLYRTPERLMRAGTSASSPTHGGSVVSPTGSAAASPISADTYARLMNCGQGKAVLTHLQRREAASSSCSMASPMNSPLASSRLSIGVGSPSMLSTGGGSTGGGQATLDGVTDTYVMQYGMASTRSSLRWK